MKKEVILTKDGSTTIFIPEWNETYHSKHGAIQEAYHVYIHNGLLLFKEKKKISIMELGFGTGLNCFITYLESVKSNQLINYIGIDAYPLDFESIKKMNYCSELDNNEIPFFETIHTSEWDKPIKIKENFNLHKKKKYFQEVVDFEQFDLIYFDAFGYDVQPELWTQEIFLKMFNSLKKNGILVTYACRSVIIKSMLSCGFKIEKLKGAPGKREMLRCYKL